MAQYNGHKNYNAWNVSLWINNDETLYHLMRKCIRTSKNRKEAAEKLCSYLPAATPDGVAYTVTNVRLAMVGEK